MLIFAKILSLTATIALFALAAFVYLKNRRGLINRTFSLYMLSGVMWSLGISGVIVTASPSTALVWIRILNAGLAFIPACFLHLVFTFLNLEKKRKYIPWIYGISFVFLILSFSPLFTRGVTRLPYGFVASPGSLFPLFLIALVAMFSYGHFELYRSYRSTTGIRRNQIKYFFLGTIIVVLGGLSVLPSIFGFPMLRGFPVWSFTNVLYGSILTYAIVTFRLLDITVAITRGTVFTIVYVFVLGIPVGVGLWGKTYLSDKIGENWWLVSLGIMLILATLGPTFYSSLRRKAEAKRKRYQENLIALAKQMTLTKDLRSLQVYIIRNVTREIGISHARIYILDKKANEFIRGVHYGKERRKQLGAYISEDAPLIRMLYRSRDIGPLLKEEVISTFETDEPEHLEEVKGQVRSMGAAILLPAFIGRELVAFLSLGTKRTKEIYTPDDINMFKILAGQAALAIENAQFYQELKEAQATILQASKLSSIGELAAGFAHQIDNPLAIISCGAELCIRDLKDLLGKEDQSEEEKKKILETIKNRQAIIMETVQRGADLVRRIKGYAKPSDKDFEPTDLNSVIDDALVLAQYQISMGGVSVTKDIPQDLPKIKGVDVQLEQALLNMIINACEAMAGKKGNLAISARIAKDNPDKVEITVSDNGRGILKENLKKMFDIFFTTKGPQGTGVGLSMAYRIIKDHDGDINVESKVGEGTKFTISLPIWTGSTQKE